MDELTAVGPLHPELSGKVAVVTGGASGLGAAMAHRFATAGMAVAVLDIDAVGAAEVATSIASSRLLDVAATSYRVDVGDPGSLEAAAAHVEATLGGCHLLCSNVGVQQFGAIERLTDDDWRWLLDVNVLGTVRTVRTFLPLLRRTEGWRRILLTASSSVLAPTIRLGAYQATKFAVLGFGDTLRLELEDEGIGVTVLFPGGMITRHLESSGLARPPEWAESGGRDDDLTAMLDRHPMADGDVVMPEDAIRNLVDDLLAGEPYSMTHGSHRPVWEQRRDALDAAFDRMEET